jgi:meiotically up-regulated gene 157 (Mug157) protein
MWLRDSTNQIISYVPYAKDDDKLKKLIMGVIYMQAEFIIKIKNHLIFTCFSITCFFFKKKKKVFRS